jgi:hypothetical protein
VRSGRSARRWFLALLAYLCLFATGCSSLPFIGPTATPTPVAPAIARPGLTYLSAVTESQETNQLLYAQLLAIAPPATGHTKGRIVIGSGAWMGVLSEDRSAVQRISQYRMCDGLTPYLFSVSPDGQWVACNPATKSVLLGRLDPNTLQLVGDMEIAFTVKGFGGVTWSPDSRSLLIETMTNGVCSWTQLERTDASPPTLRPIAVWAFPDFTIPLSDDGDDGDGGGCNIHLFDWSPDNDFVALLGNPISIASDPVFDHTWAVPLAAVNNLLAHPTEFATINDVRTPVIRIQTQDVRQLLDSAPFGTWRPALCTYTIAERAANGLVDIHAPDGARHVLSHFERWEVGAHICRILWAPDGSFAVIRVCFSVSPDLPFRSDQLYTYTPQS